MKLLMLFDVQAAVFDPKTVVLLDQFTALERSKKLQNELENAAITLAAHVAVLLVLETKENSCGMLDNMTSWLEVHEAKLDA